jgi:hypothetical protein
MCKLNNSSCTTVFDKVSEVVTKREGEGEEEGKGVGLVGNCCLGVMDKVGFDNCCFIALIFALASLLVLALVLVLEEGGGINPLPRWEIENGLNTDIIIVPKFAVGVGTGTGTETVVRIELEVGIRIRVRACAGVSLISSISLSVDCNVLYTLNLKTC